MKTRIVLFVACLLLFNSCIVKSLNPFYIVAAVKFEKAFIGDWQDDDGGIWKVASVKQTYLEEIKKDTKTPCRRFGENKAV